MFSDAKRYLERKVRKLEYVHTTLPESYELINDQYKKIRDEVNALQGVVKGLSHYEYGGTILKNFSHWSSAVAESANIKYLKRDDIYTDIAFVGSQFAGTVTDKKLKEICQNFSVAYEGIASSKRQMNERLNDIIEELTVLKKKCKQIDHQRNTVKNTRYDLEEMLQGNIYKEDEKDRLEQRLKIVSEKVLIEMKEFMHLSMINGILIKIAKVHKEFAERASQHLCEFK